MPYEHFLRKLLRKWVPPKQKRAHRSQEMGENMGNPKMTAVGSDWKRPENSRREVSTKLK